MNLLDDVLAVMDKHLETSNKHTDRNSLGKLTHFFEGGILKFIKLVFVGTASFEHDLRDLLDGVFFWKV